MERLSGIRVNKPTLVDEPSLEALRQGYKFFKLDTLPSIARQALESTDPMHAWATVGVLVRKSQQRDTSSGKPFVKWGLSGLAAGSKESTLLLSRDALSSHWSICEGSVLMLLGARALPKQEQSSAGDPLVFAADASWQVVRIGMSTDYAVCGGTKANGVRCTLAVNKSVSSYCSYHASQGIPGKRGSKAGGAGTSRSGGGGGMQQQCSVLQRQGANVQHGALGCMVRTAGYHQQQQQQQQQLLQARGGARQPAAPQAAQRGTNSLLSAGRPPLSTSVSMMGGRSSLGSNQALLGAAEDALGARAPAGGQGRSGTNPMLANRSNTQVVPHKPSLKKASASSQPSDSGDVLGSMLGDSSAAPAKSAQQATKVTSNSSSTSGGSCGATRGSADGSGCLADGDRMDGRVVVPRESHLFSQPRRGLLLQQSHGGPTEMVSAELASQIREQQILSAQAALAEKAKHNTMLARPLGAIAAAGKRPLPRDMQRRGAVQPTSSLAKRIKGMSATELAVLETRKSAFADGAADLSYQRTEAALDRLEQKDVAMQQLEECLEMKVKAYKCGVCNTLQERRGCPRGDRHLALIATVSVTKRFWQCQGCGYRTSSLGRQLCPAESCEKCRKDKWVRCGAYRGRTTESVATKSAVPVLSEDTEYGRHK
eukprot:TRINITY_DN9814_c0_g2_i1.p1 TRINITY_DN9814_c0_g2~~TRINITY_DN9814_c0_g2_i1.p1  ORF type:complete len:655 (+),score=189.97 TRINITY_DN9814_c0_g2_i1:148-2112(+)